MINISKRFPMAMAPLMAFVICGWISSSFAQETKIDVTALIKETQKYTKIQNDLTFVWWVPNEYWKAALAGNPNASPAQIEGLAKVLRPYLVTFVGVGKMGPMGGITYKPESAIRESILIIDQEGTRYRPLDPESVNPDTKNFLGMIRPVLANTLGPLGQNMHIFLFPSMDEKGQRIADPKKEGGFSAKVGERIFKWRLPLSSVVPPKICPIDGERLSGAWKYCPWHGVALKKYQDRI